MSANPPASGHRSGSHRSLTRFALLGLAIGLTLVSGCNRTVASPAGPETAAPPTAKPESGENETPENVTLSLHEAWTSRDSAFALKWTAVADSRCPIGARCIRAGEARVTLEYNSPPDSGVPESLHLSLPPSRSEGSSADVDGIRVRVLEVLPVPRVDSASAEEASLRLGILGLTQEDVEPQEDAE